MKKYVTREDTKARLEQLDSLALLVEPAKRERWLEIMGKEGEISGEDLEEIMLMLTPEGAAAVAEYLKTLKAEKFSAKAIFEKFGHARFSPLLLRRRGRR